MQRQGGRFGELTRHNVASDILAELPNRIHEVVPHVAENPKQLRQLTRLQIRPGDRVLLASENSVALSAFVFACCKLDAWPVIVETHAFDPDVR